MAKPKYYDIPVVSIGNLLVGGTGKTPVTIALARKYEKSAIVLRGYGRDSKGLYVVSHKGNILEDVTTSGDEAQLLAHALPNTTVIVSEDRVAGIKKAKELGLQIVFLDDGFSKHDIFKLDILLRPKKEPTNLFCLPSGGYRDTKMMYSFVDLVLKEEDDFHRVVTFKKDDKILENLPEKTVLVTAISKPQRLLEFIPHNSLQVVTFSDHYNYSQDDIDTIGKEYPEYSILTTQKDLVKLEKFKLSNIILMDLDITFSNNEVYERIDTYIEHSKNV